MAVRRQSGSQDRRPEGAGPDRREWWSWEPPPSPVRPTPRTHPLQPRWGFRGPLRWFWVSPREACSVGGYYPPRTHPAIPRPYTRPSRARVTCHGWDGAGVRGACTYGRFRRSVGEPRGMRTQPVLGSQAGLYSSGWFTRPFDWVWTCFMTVLLSLVPVLLSSDLI